jgi:hypothetical protein
MTNEKYPIETWKYEDWKNNFKTKKEFDKFVKEAKKNKREVAKIEKENKKNLDLKEPYSKNCRSVCKEYFEYVFSVSGNSKQVSPFIIFEKNKIYTTYYLSNLLSYYYDNSVILHAWPGKWRTDIFCSTIDDFKYWRKERKLKVEVE